MGADFLWDYASKCRVSGLIDFTSGIFASGLGYRNVELRKWLEWAHYRWGLHSYTYRTEVRDAYEGELCKWCGYESCHLFTTGSEAVEAALRLARGWKKGRRRIWGIAGNFHGKTLFSRLPPEYGTWIHLESVLEGHIQFANKRPAGIIVEGYRGWDCHFWEDRVVNWLKQWQERGALIVFDEVQSGFGRTGRKFAYEWYESLVPDILVIGKGSHSGFPGSAILSSGELLAPWKEDFSSTHGGGPLACASGLATIEEFERLDLIKESERKGEILHGYLASIGCRSSGRGLVAAIHFSNTSVADTVVRRCISSGLLVVHTSKSTVKLGPPLTIPDEVLLEGLEILKGVLSECA